MIPADIVDIFQSEKGEEIRKALVELDEKIIKDSYCVCDSSDKCTFHADLERMGIKDKE